MKKVFRRLATAALAVVALTAVLAGCLWASSWNDGPHPDKNSIELKEAKAIATALNKYADANANAWPPSLESLKPEYREPTIDVTRYRFFYPGRLRWGRRDGRVIAATEAIGFTNDSVCIYGFGDASYLRQGE